ncbi:tryptophan-rich sensory protein [bacterium]|nr:tryptophan-rich sensory protein [bacterium]
MYPIILLAYGFAIVQILRGRWPATLLVPIVINLVANFAFTPIQFGLRNLVLAEVDIVVVLVTAVWSIVAIWPRSPFAAAALIPYAVWVSIATALQTAILWLNR